MVSDQDLELQEKFFGAFIERRGDFSQAIADVQVTRKTFYRWLRDDESFKDRYDKFRLSLAEEIENNAVQRVLNPTSNRGSDALVSKLLTGLKPDRYSEKKDAPSAQTFVFISGLRSTPRQGVIDADSTHPPALQPPPDDPIHLAGDSDNRGDDSDAQGDAAGGGGGEADCADSTGPAPGIALVPHG